MTNKKATVRNIAAIAREAAPKAIARLEALIDDPDPRVAIQASAHILDRAVGKPLAMTADVTDRLDDFTDDELEALRDNLRRQIADNAGEDRAEDSVPPVTH